MRNPKRLRNAMTVGRRVWLPIGLASTLPLAACEQDSTVAPETELEVVPEYARLLELGAPNEALAALRQASVSLHRSSFARPALDLDYVLQTENRHVYYLDGPTLRNPTVDTDPGSQLFNVVGSAVPATWGEWRDASAHSIVWTTGGRRIRSYALIQFTGLIPNGVYSVFYVTFQPDSEQPDCRGVERSLPLESISLRQSPDASSFAADDSGRALYLGRSEGDLLAAAELIFTIVYHLDGMTYHPFPNRGEFFTQGPGCRATYGEDAMRQLLILQKRAL